MKFHSLLFAVASIIFAAVAANVNDIKADVAKISSLVTSLDRSVNDFPATGGTLSQGINIGSNVINLGSGLDKGTVDVKATPPFSEADAKAILGSFKSLLPTVLHLLANIITKKSAFEHLPFPGIAGLVRDALVKLHASTSAFENALIASDPGSVKGEAEAAKASVDAAFANAIKAFS
ncbi:hypothetical protein Hypma_001609 [Hypsizygus marmoreus]|uniref:Uncharacterized protein n=1 Tax=Hypsizygus marmoreus TaxID=39966 RepID=A0A369J698_HYPMA|nr:hypothetical protein Hypma_001609 [Hypsizygus marmoreus]